MYLDGSIDRLEQICRLPSPLPIAIAIRSWADMRAAALHTWLIMHASGALSLAQSPVAGT